MIDILIAAAESSAVFFALCALGLIGGLWSLVSGLVDLFKKIRRERRRDVRPFDGWRGGRL